MGGRKSSREARARTASLFPASGRTCRSRSGPPAGSVAVISSFRSASETGTDNEARALLAGVGGNTAQIIYPSSLITNSDQGNWADEYARFLRNADVSSKEGVQSITTHTIGVWMRDISRRFSAIW